MFGILFEFCQYLNTRKRFWLVPIVIVLGMFSVFIAMVNGTAIGPFIYVMF